MEFLISNIHKIGFGVGIWYVLNGVLHDVFVIAQHKGGYDRNLLGLLKDGHILIVSGLLLMFIYPALRDGSSAGLNLALLATASILIYCFMIFPFLKSIGTIVFTVAFLILILIKFFS